MMICVLEKIFIFYERMSYTSQTTQANGGLQGQTLRNAQGLFLKDAPCHIRQSPQPFRSPCMLCDGDDVRQVRNKPSLFAGRPDV